jgi:hypothetical protein
VLVPEEARQLVCHRCGKMVDSACGGYWFLLLAPRGRVVFPAAPSRHLDVAEPTPAESVLCAFCGRGLREYLEEGAYAPGEAYERSRKSNRTLVSGPGRVGDVRGARGPGVVGTSERREAAGVEGFYRVAEFLPKGTD